MLTVRHSEIGRLLSLLAWLPCAAAGYLISRDGYSDLALLLLPLVVLQLRRLGRQQWAGSRLRWRRGAWWLETGDRRLQLQALHQGAVLPWLTQVHWRRGCEGPWQGLWLFSDSAARDELCAFRRRLLAQQSL